jgi:predicted nucleic acid-binding protein
MGYGVAWWWTMEYGKQVHDTRLVAAMIVHRVTHLLTLDAGDFLRFPEITVVHPQALVEVR